VHNLDRFYGGVALTSVADFRRVNGYANCYWGWGPEDGDLVGRYLASGMPTTRRRGTFNALEHIHRGMTVDGGYNETALKNRQIHASRWHGQPADWSAINREIARIDSDGLNSLKFELLGRETAPKPDTDERGISVEMVTVRLANPM
jgi:hypothetical protein